MTDDQSYSPGDEELARLQEDSRAVLQYAGVKLDDIRRMDLNELMQLVIEKPMLSKVVVFELGRRPRKPDPVAGETLIRAYREGRAHGWLTALFLSVGAEGGYEVAREILLDAPLLQAESHATSTMVAFDRNRACSDLLEIICDDKAHARSRRYACEALRGLNDDRIAPRIVDAVRGGRLGQARAQAVLRGQPLTMEQLTSWLDATDDPMTNVAFDVACLRLERLGPALAQTMRAALLAGRIDISQTEREKIEERIAKLL